MLTNLIVEIILHWIYKLSHQIVHLNIYNFICQLCLNKTEKQGKQFHFQKNKKNLGIILRKMTKVAHHIEGD